MAGDGVEIIEIVDAAGAAEGRRLVGRAAATRSGDKASSQSSSQSASQSASESGGWQADPEAAAPAPAVQRLMRKREAAGTAKLLDACPSDARAYDDE